MFYHFEVHLRLNFLTSLRVASTCEKNSSLRVAYEAIYNINVNLRLVFFSQKLYRLIFISLIIKQFCGNAYFLQFIKKIEHYILFLVLDKVW